MMVLLLLLNLNLVPLLNLVVLNVEIFHDTASIVTVTKKGRMSRLIPSYHIATLGPAQITAVNHSIVMVVKNVGTADMVDMVDLVLVVPQTAAVAAVDTTVTLPSVPRMVAYQWEEWAESSVALVRTPEMLRWKISLARKTGALMITKVKVMTTDGPMKKMKVMIMITEMEMIMMRVVKVIMIMTRVRDTKKESVKPWPMVKKKVDAMAAIRYVGEKIVQEVTGGVYEGRKNIGKYGQAGRIIRLKTD